MDKWYIKFYMKSGAVLYGSVPVDDFKTTDDVADLFAPVEDTICGVSSDMNGYNLFVKTNEIEAFDISSKQFIK